MDLPADFLVPNCIGLSSDWVLIHFPLDKMATISQTTFLKMHFLELKVLHFDSNLTEVCSSGSNWQQVSIGSGNGLVPNRRQAIIWTDADPIFICCRWNGLFPQLPCAARSYRLPSVRGGRETSWRWLSGLGWIVLKAEGAANPTGTRLITNYLNCIS